MDQRIDMLCSIDPFLVEFEQTAAVPVQTKELDDLEQKLLLRVRQALVIAVGQHEVGVAIVAHHLLKQYKVLWLIV